MFLRPRGSNPTRWGPARCQVSQRSAISHFLGNRDAVIAAVVERSCDYYIDLIETIAAENEPADVPDALVAELIGGKRADPGAMVLFDEILTLSHHDDQARGEIERAYGVLDRVLLEGLARPLSRSSVATEERGRPRPCPADRQRGAVPGAGADRGEATGPAGSGGGENPAGLPRRPGHWGGVSGSSVVDQPAAEPTLTLEGEPIHGPA